MKTTRPRKPSPGPSPALLPPDARPGPVPKPGPGHELWLPEPQPRWVQPPLPGRREPDPETGEVKLWFV
jgi:hypothetical protein